MTTDEELRDEMAELAWGVLVAAGMRDETRGPSPSVLAHAIVGNLLPVVRRVQAEELREVADHLISDFADVLDVHARADALDPEPVR